MSLIMAMTVKIKTILISRTLIDNVNDNNYNNDGSNNSIQTRLHIKVNIKRENKKYIHSASLL